MSHRRIRLIAFAALFLPLCLCCAGTSAFLFGSNVVGFAMAKYTQYPNAVLAYTGAYVLTSSHWQSYNYVFWTPDNIEAVRGHYQHYFPKLAPGLDANTYSYRDVVLNDESSYWFNFGVKLIDATLSTRKQLLDFTYDNQLNTAIEKLPFQGTVIIFGHSMYVM